MDDYKEIMELLKPRRDIKASDALRAKVSRATVSRKVTRRRWLLGGISLSAAAALLILLLVPSGMSAKEILAQAIEVLANSENIEMVVEVRTRPVENFRYIDLSEDFVSHHVSVSDSDSTVRWRVDKGGRVAMGDGRDIYTWIPKLNIGWHIAGSDTDEILGYLATLLRPGDILEKELEYCVRSTDAEYSVAKNEKEIVLTVHSGPQGNLENPYLLNTSVVESENVRTYVIDADTKQLKSVTVSVISGNREVPVLKVSDINYGKVGQNICALPADISFVEFDDRPGGLRGLSAEEAASTFLNAFAQWNDEVIDNMLMHDRQNAIYREYYHGARLDSIGHSFTSGLGNSIFVPYKLRLRDGTVQRHNIALQKTDSGSWVVVGGL